MRLGPRIGSAFRPPAEAAFIVALLSFAAVPSTQSSTINIPYGRSWPRSIVVDPARQSIYVDGLSGIYPPTGFSFGVINSSSQVVTNVLALNGTAGELSLDEKTGTVYAAGNDSVAVFDSVSKAFVRTIDLKMPVFSIAFDGSTGHLLVASGDSVVQLDPATGSVMRTAVVGHSAEGMAIDPSRGEVFVANYLSSSVSVLRSADLSTVTTISLLSPSYPSQLALDQRRGILYATTNGRFVVRVSTANDSLLGSLAVSRSDTNGTYALAIDPARNRLFVAAEPGRSVAQLDASTGALVGTFALDSAAFEMAVDEQSGKLYVTNYHQVTVITPAETAQVGQRWLAPGELAALVGVAAAVAAGTLVWRATPSGGRRGGSPSRQRTTPSWSPSFLLRPRAAHAP